MAEVSRTSPPSFKRMKSLSTLTGLFWVAPYTPLPLQDGDTPLHYAADSDHVETVRLLLDSGADKEAKTIVRGERIAGCVAPDRGLRVRRGALRVCRGGVGSFLASPAFTPVSPPKFGRFPTEMDSAL